MAASLMYACVCSLAKSAGEGIILALPAPAAPLGGGRHGAGALQGAHGSSSASAGIYAANMDSSTISAV